MADPNYPYLSSNIKSLRRVYGEEQLDLANAIGLTIPAVSNYERGERIPKRDIIARIAKHYRITEDELLYSDLSNMKNISNRPFYDPIFNCKVMDKMFALIDLESANKICLKCDPEYALELREHYAAIEGAYHFNKKYWNQVFLDGDVDDKLLKQLIDHSMEEVLKKFTKKMRTEYEALP